jgi:excisionase family DNA binding protein
VRRASFHARRIAKDMHMTDLPSIDPVTVTVLAAMKYSGLGRTKLYELITKGEIESIRVGTRRLIVFASLKARLTNKAGEVGND